MINEINANDQQSILNPSAGGMNVLVAYDNLRSGIKAKHLCDRLAQHLAPPGEFRISFWSLSALQLPQLARAAEEEAVQTDLLIVAVNGDGDLRPCVKSWFSRCARRIRSNGGALTAQFHGILRMHLELSPAYECLKQIADNAGLDFFSEVVEPTDETLDNSIESIHKRAHMGSPMLDAILQLH
jgi:hypothetical protein